MNFKNFFVKDVKGLTKSSANVLDVFTKTVNKLTEINSQALEGVNKRNLEIQKLSKESEDLRVLRASNNKVIDKLNQILKD